MISCLKIVLRHWQKLGERTRLSVDANYLRADGDYPFTLKNGKVVTEEKRINSALLQMLSASVPTSLPLSFGRRTGAFPDGCFQESCSY